MDMGTSILLQVLVAWMLVVGAAADGRSLAFVFDSTGSMSDELTQAIAGAQSILQAALNSTQRDWRDFILVPFNDPNVGPVTVTSDPDEFKTTLAAIEVNGGGDCPEMSIGGINEALEVSRPQSYLYVFTDATAKDYHLADQVIATIQEKQCKVVFVMTGNCGERSSEGFQVYVRIASASSGQVFEVEKGNVADVLQAVIIITIEDYGTPPSAGGPAGSSEVTETNLVSLDSPTATRSGGENAVVTVDSGSSDFTVSLSGGDPAVTVYDPTGEQLEESKVQTVLKLPKLEIIKVAEPEPGNYTVNYVSTSSHSIRIKGLSRIGFDQRFSTSNIAVEFESAAPRPYQGIPVHTMIRGIGLQEGDVLTKLEFTELNGTVLQTLPLYSTEYNPGIYFTNATVVPNGVFLIQVFGVDNSGFSFNRISQSAISAIPAPGFEECRRCATDGTSQCIVTDINLAKYDCECKTPYFTGDGTSCENVDECALNLDNCDINANCTDTWGRFRCDCNPGWTGDGVTCYNVDECSLGTFTCDPNSNCTDTVGSYECTCNPGYEGDGRSCANIDECNLGTYSCGSNAFCKDVDGGYECHCNQGYAGNGLSCTDVDECSLGTYTCDSNANCTNTVGSYVCTCNPGYEGDGGNCTNINECQMDTYICGPNAHCRDTVGGYECPCFTGYSGCNLNCTDADECSLGTYSCDPNANCANTVGSYECSCNPGYEGDGRNCTNIDECYLDRHSCGTNSYCKDTEGGYECPCSPGFIGYDSNCTRVS